MTRDKVLIDEFFESFDEMMSFLNNRKNNDDFVIESVELFIEDNSMELTKMSLTCEEYSSVTTISFSRKQVKDTLKSMIEKFTEQEKYEDCSKILSLLKKYSDKA